jgi:hypothetical protein
MLELYNIELLDNSNINIISDINLPTLPASKTKKCTIAKKQFDLRNIASNKLELLENGKIAFTYVTKEDNILPLTADIQTVQIVIAIS